MSVCDTLWLSYMYPCLMAIFSMDQCSVITHCSCWKIDYQSNMVFKYCFSAKSHFCLGSSVPFFLNSFLFRLFLFSLYLTTAWPDLLLLFSRKSSVLWFWRDNMVTHPTLQHGVKTSISAELLSLQHSLSAWIGYFFNAPTQLYKLNKCAS